MSLFFRNFCVLFLLSTLVILGQSKEVLSTERYNFLSDSLLNEKAQLLTLKDKLTNEIDSLRNRIVDLESEYKSARFDQLVRKYGKENGNRIANGQIWKGMTEKMLEDSWGKPDKINTNKEKWGVFSQWTYGDITYFFREGKMIDWEEEK